MKFYIFATLATLLAVSQCGVLPELEETQIAPYSIVDLTIKAILGAMRPKLKDLKIPNINETIRQQNFSASILVKDIMIKNADTFVIKNLKSKVVPLQLTNLTLAWNNITATALYDVDVNVTLAPDTTPLRLFAKGDAKAILNDILFTIGAKFEIKNNVLQIKPKGLFDFDLTIKSTNINLSSIWGSTELGKSLSVFVSQIIPQIIENFKQPIFEAYQDDIIKVINQVLKKNGTFYSDDDFIFEELAPLPILDLSEEIRNFGIKF